MVSMQSGEAREFYEQDEDPAEVFARFDAAERKGLLKQTGPPPEPPSMRELGDLLRRLLLEVRLRDRIMRVLHGVFAPSEGRSKVN